MSLSRLLSAPRSPLLSRAALTQNTLRIPHRFVNTPSVSAASPASSSASASASSTTASTEHLSKFHAAAKRNYEAGNLSEAYGLSKEAGAFGESGLLQKYGSWTVGGLALAAAVSNEWILLGEETPVLLTFVAVVFAGYVNLREQVSTAIKTELDARYAQYGGAIDSAISSVEKSIKLIESSRDFPQQHQQSWNSFKDLLQRYSAALSRSSQVAINQRYEARLDALIKSEQRFKDKKDDDVRASVGRFLREKFRSKPATYRDGLVTDALSSLLFLQHQAWQKSRAVEPQKALSFEPFQQALKALNVKVQKPQDLAGLAQKASQRGSLVQQETVENPQIKAIYDEFLTEWNKKSGKPVVRTLSDAEYQKLVGDAEKQNQHELQVFEKQAKAERDALVANPPALLKGDNLTAYLAEFDARVAQQRELIKARKVVPSKQVTEFRPFYSS